MYHWYPKHVYKTGRFNGLYYNSHTAETHDAWKERSDKRYKARCTRGSDGSGTDTQTPDPVALQISDTLENALCTNLCVSEDDLNKTIDSAGLGNRSPGEKGLL